MFQFNAIDGHDSTDRRKPVVFLEQLENRDMLSASPAQTTSGAASEKAPAAIEIALHPAVKPSDTPASAQVSRSAALRSFRSRPVNASTAAGSRSSSNVRSNVIRAGVFAGGAPLATTANVDDTILITRSGTLAGALAAQRRAASAPAASSAIGANGAHSFAGRPPKKLAKLEASPRRVLLIEDDAGTRQALSRILQLRGFVVTAVPTLADGMKQLATRPDHIVTDLMLPDGDATQLLQYVHDAHLSIPVTVTTGVSDSAKLGQVRQLGPESVLAKPVNVAELMKHLGAPK